MKDLITILGFLGAGYLFFTWYGKSGHSTSLMNETGIEQPAIAESRIMDYDVASNNLERPDEVSRNRSRNENRQLAIVAPSAASTSTKASATSIRKAIDRLADAAISRATDKRSFVPAGASLTMLIMGAEKGKQVSESNLQKVMNLLYSIKQDAPHEDMQYFKYSSNSEKWFEGLQLDHNGGYNISDLLRIYDQYDLRKYDKNVMAIVSSSSIEYSKTYEAKSAAPAMKGDATDADMRRNYAFAKNRWAEKEAAGTEADLKFVAAEAISASSSSTLHRKVAALKVGDSLSFSDPDEYYAALKELIAVENGFSSWKNYENEMGKDAAKRVFRKRSEKGGFFSSGGLKITREN